MKNILSRIEKPTIDVKMNREAFLGVCLIAAGVYASKRLRRGRVS